MKILNRIPMVHAYRNRHEPEALHKLADMYWKLLVILCATLLVVFIAYDLWQFSTVSKMLAKSYQESAEKNPIEVLPFKKEEVQAMRDALTRRQSTYQRYSTEAPAITDPSK